MDNICDDTPAVLFCLSLHFLTVLLNIYIINHDFVANDEREIV